MSNTNININQEVRQILISFGRIDQGNATAKLFNLLPSHHFQTIKIALSSQAPHLNKIKKLIDSSPTPTELIIDAPNLYDHFINIDLIVGSGGVGLLERMAAGIPSLTFTTATNQRLNVATAVDNDATINAGELSSFSDKKFRDQLGSILFDQKIRQKLADNGKELIDGKGVQRIINQLANNPKNSS